MSYRAAEVGTQESCELNADAPGSGELVFKAGALKFAIVENRVAGTALLSLTGSRGGSATAVTAVNSPNPATAGAAVRCERRLLRAGEPHVANDAGDQRLREKH